MKPKHLAHAEVDLIHAYRVGELEQTEPTEYAYWRRHVDECEYCQLTLEYMHKLDRWSETREPADLARELAADARRLRELIDLHLDNDVEPP